LNHISTYNFYKGLFTFILFAFLFSSSLSILEAQTKIIGYYPDWVKGDLPPSKIEFSNLTDIIHAFAWPNSDGSISMYDGLVYPALNQAVHNANEKILISMGGAGQSDGFAPMSADSSTRATFINNVINFLETNHYDGVDIDWEVPVNNTQAQQLTTLIKEMRQKFDEVDSTWLITMAVPADASEGQFFEFEKMVNYVNWFGVMAYDFYGSWSSTSGPNAPLYKSRQNVEGSGSDAVQYMNITRKVPKNKLVFGIPFYGKEFNTSGWYKPFTGSVPEYTYSDAMSTVANGKWQYNWDNTAEVPFYINSDSTKLITFDDTASIHAKVEFSMQQQLAGIMIWALGQDLYNGGQPLLEEVGKAVKELTYISLAVPDVISSYKLFNNYPNPFNPSTKIRFSVPREGVVKLIVYDILGREVSVLFNREVMPGTYEVTFNGSNLSSGMYLYSLVSEGYRITKKMLLVK
jgi:chitinase